MSLVKSSTSLHQGVVTDINSFVEEKKEKLDNVEGSFIDKLELNPTHNDVGLYPRTNMNVKKLNNNDDLPESILTKIPRAIK